MSKVPNISDAEWEVMKVIWMKSSPCKANEIVEALAEHTDWKPNTIKTLIGRLVKKGAIAFREEGKVYLYYPRITEAESIKAESKSFLTRVFGGAIKPALVTFLQEEKLTQEDIEDLKRLLEERKE